MRRNKGKATGFLLEGWGEMGGGVAHVVFLSVWVNVKAHLLLF